MNRHVCFCSLHKPLLISSAVKKTLLSTVKYVVVQDLVFLLVWMLALATTMISSILMVDVIVRRGRPKRKRRFLGKNLAKGHVIFA